MKKKLYLQPAIDVMGIQPLQLLDATRGWSQDGNTPTEVEQEGRVGEDGELPSSNNLWGDDDEYDDFLDLD